MQLTRCCFVFLVQGSLYLVSGRRGAAGGWGSGYGGGQSAGSFGARKLSPCPPHPRDAGSARRPGERAGPRPEEVRNGLIGAGSGGPAGPPIGRGWRELRPAAAQRPAAGSPGVTRPLPGARAARRGAGVSWELGTRRVQGARARSWPRGPRGARAAGPPAPGAGPGGLGPASLAPWLPRRPPRLLFSSPPLRAARAPQDLGRRSRPGARGSGAGAQSCSRAGAPGCPHPPTPDTREPHPRPQRGA